MKITSLKVRNFRNIEGIEFIPSEEINIIHGSNAQGKTNIIEALWLFTGEKSFRGTKDKEMILFGENKAKLNLEFFASKRKQEAEIEIENKRKATLNGINLTTARKLAEEIHEIVFSPEHLSLVKAGPEERRDFLNVAISKLYGTYSDILRKYYRVLKQRNTILKDAEKNPSLLNFLEDFDISLATYGESIIKMRKKYTERIKEYIPKFFSGLSDNKETLEIEYNISFEAEKKEEILEMLKENLSEDKKTQRTSVGPHRDDLTFYINGIDARTFGSQGQQRSIVLALKMAEAELLKEITGEKPIILLDDVMSELDPKRQDYLLNHIKGEQVFITCCDPDTIKRLKEGKTFLIEKGRIKE